MSKNTIMYLAAGLVVAAVLGTGIFWNLGHPSSKNITMQNSSGSSTADNIVSSKNNTKLSYGAAVKLYTGKRIQFSDDCLVIPNKVTFKTGTTIMLDNRTNGKNVISLDDISYTINPYDYILITLHTNFALPHAINVESNNISCGNGENNGSILLQK